MLIFDVFDITETDAVFNRSIEVDPSNAEQVRNLFELTKDKDVYVDPQTVDGIDFLTRPRKRGRAGIPDAAIVHIHVLCVEQNKSTMAIMSKIYEKFGILVSSKNLMEILSQKKYVDVPGIDHLRPQAEAKMPKKTGRKKKIDEDMQQEIYRMYESGMSGNAIAKVLKISSMSVNNYIRAKYGYRKKVTKTNAELCEVTNV